ncbi:ATP-binding protein [Streptomyces lunaelactis]|uniref:ATP-binding protein n=1 Tax=Streptomyces lunaelactis TaxID=1535768 RepID=UPI0026B050B2|nr:ATP-binding protein [Streptomyces lunaelactis]
MRHGHVPGRDFHLCLAASPAALRIDITETRAEQRPCRDQALPLRSLEQESGRGLLLVDALAADWGVTPRTGAPGAPGAPGKTGWAVVAIRN